MECYLAPASGEETELLDGQVMQLKKLGTTNVVKLLERLP